jgi:hypothetical protein
MTTHLVRTQSTATAAEQATLTFWIPERIDALLAAQERCQSRTRSDTLRGMLRQHLYGLSGDADSNAALPPPVAQPSRGQWGGRLPGLGKNSVEAKLSLQRRWREDLSALAAEAGITLSHFVREIVVMQLLGHAYLSARVVWVCTDSKEEA